MDENKNSQTPETGDRPEPETNPVQSEKGEAAKGERSFLNFLKTCFSCNNRKRTIAVILAALIAAGVITGVILYNSPKSVALRYAEALVYFDYNTLGKLLAYDFKDYEYKGWDEDKELFFEVLSNQYDEDIKNWRDLYKVRQNIALEEREDQYGDCEHTCKVSKIKDISKRKFKEDYIKLLDKLEARGVFDYDTLGQGCKLVTVKVKTVCEDEKILRDTVTMVLVKSPHLWKVIDYNFS